jgi:hypothetical protein
MASSLPNLITKTMTASLSPPTKTIAMLASLPNVMALTQSASPLQNHATKLNKQLTINKTEQHLPSCLNSFRIIVGIFLAVLFLNKIFETLREIYESISKTAECICASNDTLQDEERYYKRDESEHLPRVFLPLARTIQAVLCLRRRTKDILQSKIFTILKYLFQPLYLQSTRSFPRGLRSYPAKMLITSHIMLHEAWYNWVTTGDRGTISFDTLGFFKHTLSGLESWIRLSPFLSQSRRPPDPLQHNPTTNQRFYHAIRTANHIAQSTASFLCTIMLRITTQVAKTLTRPLRGPINHLAFSLAHKITNQSAEKSDNTPKTDFDMDTLTQATHELHLINPENERNDAENTKLLAHLTALVSAELQKKGKAIFDPGGKSVCIDTGASGTIWI